METIGRVTDAYRDGKDVVLTVARNPGVNYRRWKEVMDLLEDVAKQFKEDDMKCFYCGKRANFEGHIPDRSNGAVRWKTIYLCGTCMNDFVLRRMHEERARA